MMMSKKYKYGISTTVDLTVDCRTLLDHFAGNHFDFISLAADPAHAGFYDRGSFSQLQEFAEERGVPITSTHAPFGGKSDLASPDHRIREEAIESLLRHFEYAESYGLRQVIVHPHYYFLDRMESCMERAARSLEVVLLSKPDSVELAIENLPQAEGSWICEQLLGIFNRDRLGFCYDSSHENISGRPFHLLEKHVDRVTVTHLSDNHGELDEHLVPGDGNIDWKVLRSHLDESSTLNQVLFEVGTGEQLAEPVAQFINRAAAKAREFFG